MIKKEKEIERGTFELTVKAVVLNSEGQTLLLKRPDNDDLHPGKYDLVGGHVDTGEKLEDALKREIKEEIGLVAKIGPVMSTVDFKNDDGSIFGKGIRYIAYCNEGTVELNEEEHDKFEWVTLDEAIDRFEDKGYESDKRLAVIKAKEYLELKKSLDGWRRCLADFENYRKMQNESGKELLNLATENLVFQMLPILDNFHASTEHVPEDQKNNAWVTGIMHIQKQLETFLKDNGVEEVETKVGDEFNPEVHEAIHSNSNDSNKHSNDANVIKKIVSKGYKINHKVIRAVKVIVE